MSLKEKALHYFLEEKKNCAVSILLGSNDYYGLNLGETDYKLVMGFGGGIGSGYICGLLAGSISVLGVKFSTRQDFRALCAKFVSLFEQELGSKDCKDIIKTYHDKNTRCSLAVRKCADLLEEYIASIN